MDNPAPPVIQWGRPPGLPIRAQPGTAFCALRQRPERFQPAGHTSLRIGLPHPTLAKISHLILDRLNARLDSVERKLAAVARRKRLAVALCGLIALGVRALEAPRMPVPVPRLRDEFSYLLAADTFASGRLTNPTHPLWQHFESIHILQLPTYMSMYPPAQGMFLALGQKLTGLPWIGVWLSMALFCAALCWMLQGWLPPSWAFFGALLAISRIGVFTYWMNTYWGGAVAGIGGALLFGALPRVMRRPNLRDGCLLALGVALLMNSRPFEGMIAAAPVAVALILWLFRKSGAGKTTRLAVVAAPAAALILLAFAWTGYYNWRVTGDPFVLPQELSRRTYAVAPYFLWESERPAPTYHNEVMRKFYTQWEGGFQHADDQDTFDGFVASLREKFIPIWHFYLGLFLTLPLILLPMAIRDRRVRFWLWSTPFFIAAILMERFTQIHYLAPANGAR